MNHKPQETRQELFTDAYQKYSPELRRRARFMINSAETTEDVLQDVFMRTWMYMVRGGKIDKARAFLYRVLNNAIVDTYRKHKTYSLEVYLKRGVEPGEDDSGRVIDLLDGKQALNLVKRLPKRYQKVLRMKYEEGLSLPEISNITGQSRNTVAVQAHRGLERLKLLYGQVPG